MDHLRRRYTSLGAGELTAAAVFVVIASTGLLPITRTPTGRLALWSALVPLLVILVQAGVYWIVARSWLGGGTMPRPMAALYRAFRILNPLLLAAGLVGVLVWLPRDANAVLALGVWAFGVIEYVNYYVVRLAYPWRTWARDVTSWRTPRLVIDLRAA